MDKDKSGFSRRALLVGAAAGSVTALAPAAFAWEAPNSQAHAPVTSVAGAPTLVEFGYSQIAVTGERQKAQADNVRSILLGLDEDSLLKPFREMSGKPGPGVSLGGWYAWKADYDPHHDDVGFAPGHCFGQWVSAMARLHAATGDPALGAKATRLNALLAEGIGPGYFEQTRFPAYTYDKLLCGLMDGHRLAADPAAFKTLDQITGAALPSLPGRAIERETQWKLGKDNSWMWDESYTSSENLYLVSGLMTDPAAKARYHAMAQAYLDDPTYFMPLAHGVNAMSDRHAYSYVNALCSAMQAWLVDGSQVHLDAARNAFGMLQEQSFATGGWGPDELLRKPGTDDVASSLGNTHRGFETPCGSYAHMKLTRYLLRSTGDGRYGDSMERVMLNTVLGALPLEPDGHAFYYSDYNEVAQRSYFVNRWPCCAGSLPQVVADYGINSYLYQPAQGPAHDEARPTAVRAAESSPQVAGVWVNLYQPSTLRWTEGQASLSLEQSGGYPETDTVRLRITASKPTTFALHMRVPAWAGDGVHFRVNGEPLAVKPAQGFVVVTREWVSGNSVEMVLPMPLRLEPLPGHPELVAVVRGPLVLFPLRTLADGTGPLRLTREELLGAEQVNGREWVVRTGSDVRSLVPFTEVGDRLYSTYINTRVG